MTQVATPATLIGAGEWRGNDFCRPAIPINGERRQYLRLRPFVRRQGIWSAARGGSPDRFAHSSDFVERNRAGTDPRTVSVRLHYRRKNVGADHADFSHASQRRGKRTRSGPGMAPAWIVTLLRVCRSLLKATGGTRVWPSLASPAKPVIAKGANISSRIEIHFAAGNSPDDTQLIRRSPMPNE